MRGYDRRIYEPSGRIRYKLQETKLHYKRLYTRTIFSNETQRLWTRNSKGIKKSFIYLQINIMKIKKK